MIYRIPLKNMRLPAKKKRRLQHSISHYLYETLGGKKEWEEKRGGANDADWLIQSLFAVRYQFDLRIRIIY